MRIAMAIVPAALGATATAPSAADDDPGPEPNPLARDYVDIGIHFGPAWRANVVDGRYSPFGLSGGAVPAGYDYGVALNGLMLAAALGVSVDPAEMVLAVRDAIVAIIPRGARP